MADPKKTLEDFAALCAELADPLVPRAAALASAGLADEPALAALRAAWTAKLTDDASLRGRFRAAFADARARHEAPEPRAEDAAAVPLLATGQAPPLKTPTVELHSAVVALRNQLDTTGEVMPRVLPEIPFVEVERDAFGIPKLVAAAIARGAGQREDTGTVALAPDSAPTGPATPFEKAQPKAPSAAADEEVDLDATTEFRPNAKDKP